MKIEGKSLRDEASPTRDFSKISRGSRFCFRSVSPPLAANCDSCKKGNRKLMETVEVIKMWETYKRQGKMKLDWLYMRLVNV